MRPFHHREPGILAAALNLKGLRAQIIADGIHLHPATVKFFIDTRGVDNVLLITDGVRAVGYPDGEYEMGGQMITVRGMEARLATGTLCGSRLTLIQAVERAVRFAKISLCEAVRCASLIPARSIGVDDEYGSIEVGKVADLVAINSKFQVERTYLAGELIYQR
jgi:N-acetylglucosamine-6-phosphate deacetylase